MNGAGGVLHLIPVTLGDVAPRAVLPLTTVAAISALDYFIVENAKSARQFLKNAGHPKPLRELTLERFDKDASVQLAERLLEPLLEGRSAGLLSEAGCPAVADPGAMLVAAAHRRQLRVVPHVGPSAVLLALMASGFNGQRFAFHGYLPIAKDDCRRSIIRLERESRASNTTQVFIETPYRNEALLAALLESCSANTRLCIASALTLSAEKVRSATIAEWKTETSTLGRVPSVFLIYAC
jgi:16S rRNA (cytidine1402-2'-O)-methyltransferase